MKRLYIALTFVLFSFLFLFGREVKADYIYTQEIDLSLINEDFYSFKNYVDDFINNDNSSSPYYFILYSSNKYVAYIPMNSNNGISPHVLSCASNRIYYYNNPSFSFIRISSDSLSSSTTSVSSIELSNSTTYFIYSNVEFIFSSKYSIVYTSGEDTWLTSKESEEKYFSVYDVYQEVYSESEEPVPVDNTPILTDFYSIVIEKIGYLCRVIVSNYIYLSIFVIILIIILFEFIFRRRL